MVADRQTTATRDARPKPGDTDAPEQPKDKRAEFLTARQLAELLQISESTVHRLRRAGRIPAVMLTGRLIRFNLKDVQKALKQLQQSRAGTPDGDDERDREPSPQLSFDDLYSDFNAQA
jgi:excisionase family DNA binding protein